MKNKSIHYWIDRAIDSQITRNVERLASAPGVTRVAVMPDIHLSKKICNGVAIASNRVIFPEAVGGDIGCGYLMADVDGSQGAFRNARKAEKLLQRLSQSVPIIRHSKETMATQLPDDLLNTQLTCESLEKMKQRDARVQWGTLGRGNHFVEFQKSSTGRIHLLLHSGSRAVGPAILAHHLKSATYDEASKLLFLDAESAEGQAYLHDMQWARSYAAANRLRMLEQVHAMLAGFGMSVDFESVLDRDHNHVQQETHGSQTFWLHRKGTQRLPEGEIGIIPGSMGTPSFVVSGRGSADAFLSCSHGAGRRMSRTQAADRISANDLKRQMKSVHFDLRKSRKLCDEAPGAYKDIRKVMKAQKDLVRIEEERLPVLNFKSG